MGKVGERFAGVLEQIPDPGYQGKEAGEGEIWSGGGQGHGGGPGATRSEKAVRRRRW